MSINNLAFKPQNIYQKDMNSKLGFGANFSPMTEKETEAADLQIIWDVFREASKNDKKYLSYHHSISDGLMGYFSMSKNTECTPKSELVRVVNKIRKNPEYGEKLLNKIIEKSEKSVIVVLAKYSKRILKHPEFKSLVELQDKLAKAERIERKPIPCSREEFELMQKIPEMEKQDFELCVKIRESLHSCLN